MKDTITTVELPQEVNLTDWYQQEETRVAQMIIKALKGSKALTDAAKVWEKSVEDQKRIKREFEEMKIRRGDMAVEIEDLKRNIGAEDSFADLRKIEGLQSELKAIDEVLPGMERRFYNDSAFTRQIRDNKYNAIFLIDAELAKVNASLKEDIDRRAEDLILTIKAYKSATELARSEQKAIPSALLQLGSIMKIVPKIEGLEGLVELDPFASTASLRRY
ncbi:MAG: hypothetical protein J0652_01090 [Desulfobulbaceae bacterium]|nr:hypothetical protein [Desulfobulbaceae bacterium]